MSTAAHKRQKFFALMAGGLVVAAGATVTLAAWNDSEWVFGGADTDGDDVPDPGVGTTSFEVQQNTSAPFAAAAWTDEETGPGDGLTFTTGALDLTPGEVVYAPVSLRTTGDSVAAETLSLAGAASAAGVAVDDAGGELFAALDLRVVASTSTGAPAACDASAFGAGSAFVVGGETAPGALGDAGTLIDPTDGSPALAAASGDQLDFCFEVSLPAGAPDTLQGRTVAPAWQFVSTSAE